MKYMKLPLFVIFALFLPYIVWADDDAICTDRPTKTNLPCIAPTGWFQYEGDIFNWTDSSGGNTYLFTNPTFKYGLNTKIDLELNISPYEEITGHNTPVLGGVGDLYARMKYNVFNNNGAAVTLLPYVKVPTAPPGIGNKAFEEGLIVPISFTLPAGFSLVLDPEVDVFKDAQDSNYHMNYQGLVNIGHTVFSDKVTAYAEVWSGVNEDPSGTVTQVSFDTAVTWLVKPGVQFDAGANIGLNRATPILQTYAGISQLF
jgi:hypothetical protein